MNKAQLPGGVALGQPSDFDEVFDVLMENYRENGTHSLDMTKVGSWLSSGLHQHGSVIGIIRGENGIIQACCGLYLACYWYSSDVYVEEIFSYIRPEYRNDQSHAKNMSDFAEWFAQAQNAPLVHVKM